ncbi:beta-N-acetylhexosaminidase [Marinobacterium jannaschii]|uniref:beta-N-acetylhexosaminidase n=1 Tax=Marinobacterium jannaschii TaxID=64970 RepID=UPI000480B26F|nr:beta-N-acetylhexosaminidase [Marinobacterium jannaschii]
MYSASLILDLDGTSLTQAEVQLLQAPQIGGVILFGRNTESADQLRVLTRQIRALRPEIIIAIDQEGGRVQRLRNGVTRLPAMAALGRYYQRDAEAGRIAAADIGYLIASELGQLGVDLSFAPVLDLDLGRNTVIGDRAFGDDAAMVATLAAAIMSGMSDAGLQATGKHFPGHGWADTDSHLAEAVDLRTFDEIWQRDLVPFRALVAQGLAAVMPAHVVYRACDPMPAGFSSYWLQQILRQRLSFEGVIFSDDLTMKAARVVGGYAERAEAAIKAGCDALLPCNNREGAVEVLEYLQQNNIEPSSRLAAMRGQPNTPDHQRLDRSRQLAAMLIADSL